jgi:hypothetical protein
MSSNATRARSWSRTLRATRYAHRVARPIATHFIHCIFGRHVSKEIKNLIIFYLVRLQMTYSSKIIPDDMWSYIISYLEDDIMNFSSTCRTFRRLTFEYFHRPQNYTKRIPINSGKVAGLPPPWYRLLPLVLDDVLLDDMSNFSKSDDRIFRKYTQPPPTDAYFGILTIISHLVKSFKKLLYRKMLLKS